MKKSKHNLHKHEKPFIKNYMGMDKKELRKLLNTPDSMEQHIWFAFVMLIRGKTKEEYILKKYEFVDLGKKIQEFIGIFFLLLKRINSDFLEDKKNKIAIPPLPKE